MVEAKYPRVALVLAACLREGAGEVRLEWSAELLQSVQDAAAEEVEQLENFCEHIMSQYYTDPAVDCTTIRLRKEGAEVVSLPAHAVCCLPALCRCGQASLGVARDVADLDISEIEELAAKVPAWKKAVAAAEETCTRYVLWPERPGAESIAALVQEEHAKVALTAGALMSAARERKNGIMSQMVDIVQSRDGEVLDFASRCTQEVTDAEGMKLLKATQTAAAKKLLKLWKSWARCEASSQTVWQTLGVGEPGHAGAVGDEASQAAVVSRVSVCSAVQALWRPLKEGETRGALVQAVQEAVALYGAAAEWPAGLRLAATRVVSAE
jgi:hypothetical protein